MEPDIDDGKLDSFLTAHEPVEFAFSYAPGELFGDWRVTAFLGRGGSAEVYRAENEAAGIVGALKILYRADDKARARFRREAQLSAELPGAAFPKFYGAGEDSGRLYLAEELLEPMELPRDDAAVARYVLGVARAVEELHKRGFIHRDVKPRNVMVRPSTGECVLIDLGLAKEGGESPRSRNDTLSVVDGRAVGVGTPGFSAPEQFAGGKIGVAADIHALGVLANVCFNGTPPAGLGKDHPPFDKFDSRTAVCDCRRIRAGSAPPPCRALVDRRNRCGAGDLRNSRRHCLIPERCAAAVSASRD